MEAAILLLIAMFPRRYGGVSRVVRMVSAQGWQSNYLAIHRTPKRDAFLSFIGAGAFIREHDSIRTVLLCQVAFVATSFPNSF